MTAIMNQDEGGKAVTIEGCEHELACTKCGVSIGEIGLAAAEEADAVTEAALEEAAKIPTPLVTSVRVERYGGVHEGVTVWLQGALVGTLTVGEGQGEPLRRLLLSEDVVMRARRLVHIWRAQDGFNASDLDALGDTIDIVDQLMLQGRPVMLMASLSTPEEDP